MAETSDPLRRALLQLPEIIPTEVRGRVTAVKGLMLRATLPVARIGDYVHVLTTEGDSLGAEVVAFDRGEVVLMPFGDTRGVGPQSVVESTRRPFSFLCGHALLGRVIDGLGRPIDGKTAIDRVDECTGSSDASNASDNASAPLTMQRRSVDRPSPDPMRRPRITRPITLGLRAIDGLLTMGEGQRIGLFAGAGVGKSTLLGQLARCADADVAVLCLIGERGREVGEFVGDALGSGLARSVVVCATSDAPPLVRVRSASVATTVAEYFRDQGKRVLLLMDSLTRYARALREVALATGELPARRGYPPSVFVQLPRLLERSGTSLEGSITAIYTVLVEGDDLTEPVADEVRGLLDGHIVLDRRLAERGHWPAIDVLRSLSRVINQVAPHDQLQHAARLRALLASYEARRDLILLGAYQHGSDPQADEAIAKIEAIEAFLRQAADETTSLAETQAWLATLFSD